MNWFENEQAESREERVQGVEAQLRRRPDLCVWLPEPFLEARAGIYAISAERLHRQSSVWAPFTGEKQVLLVGTLPHPTTNVWNRLDESHHQSASFSPVGVKGARRNYLSQMKWGHKNLTETNPTPGVSVAPRLLLNNSSSSLPSSFYRHICNHISADRSWSLGIPSQDAVKNGGHHVDDTFTVRTLPGEENCSCSKHVDSG